MRILVMGGTRFIGVYLTRLLLATGHEVTLLNRGNRPGPEGVEVVMCDRTSPDALKTALGGRTFDAIYDNNGRELSDTQPLIELFGHTVQQFIYVSSAGVYLKSEQMPHMEGDAVDPNSRHKGKHHTEAYLKQRGIPFTAIRPVYIYGPQNYNPLEKWFFDRLSYDRPLMIPGNGKAITQLGHCEDLAQAMVAILDNPKAIGQIYNISGERYVTFDGLALACAEAMGKPAPDIRHYDPKQFDFGKRKAFPMRVQHFFTAIDKAKQELDWTPRYGLVQGLRDSYRHDYSRTEQTVDFELDEQILASS
ncbi:NAD-dependent epimerase/dehydratase family protein [Leptothoe sp. PORK10 BA2]|uniref:NAD-dependent epimerase/dehydratase family protein n=1 Tax=Leptothoe sp. PORK10 BA2 TaxID=3110254 RepID=UPI002B1F6503|nr:NAD-dependent epimerase/dehydratase family protein [Leptothoe sp. PORK10 BA2]MEA5463457.1 NAD-dependent epimerase/dehydratase family protein [Leptothoe sp. PORK10 BA2]